MKNKSILFYSGAIGLVIFLAAAAWQSAGTRAAASAPRAVAPMPNLDGEKAKRYLAENGLDKSLGAALQTARYTVNRIEPAAPADERGAFEAKNSEQEFAARFSGDGVNLVSQATGKPWNAALDLKSVGRGARQRSVNRGQWTASRTKISASHQIGTEASDSEFQIDELFENKPEGLEQSFFIHEKIEDENLQSADRPLRIVLGLSGDLRPEIAADGQTLIFTKDGAQVLRYDKLKSWDAGGRDLASRMELAGGELSLVVDDAGAVYPITVDPTFTQVKKLVGSDSAAQDAFGFSVAVSGNTAVVGAIGHSPSNIFQGGAAYVFERNAGGANFWTEVKKLTPADLTNYDYFGTSVAVDGDTVIVGAPDSNADFGGSAGAIYIFERNAGGANNWGQVRKRTPSDGVVKDAFGSSVALSGDTLIVGAPQEISAETAAGAAYIFERGAGGANNWGEVKIIEAIAPTPSSNFGYRVGISGDTAIIGVYAGDAAYIVGRDAGGANNWGAVKKLTASDGAGGVFGGAAAIDGDRAVVGAYIRTIGGSSFQGAAYVFERNAGGADNWGEIKRLVAADGAAFDNFGISVALSGDKIVVGAYQDDVGANTNQGSAYVFERNAGGANNWGGVKKLTAGDGLANDWFGWAVAVEGSTLLVGARTGGIAPTNGRGSAYVFVRANETWTQETKPLPANCTVEDYFGTSVAVSGDTAVVGATGDDVGANADQGAVYVFGRNAGGANNWGLVKTIAAADGAAGDGFGNKVAISADRIVVGTYAADSGANTNQGAAYIFERNAGGAENWGQVKKLTASDGAADDWFGYSVGISGDTVVVGALFDDVGANISQGSAYVFERNAGGANNWGEVKHLFSADGTFADLFGSAVGISGDTVVVGAYNDRSGSDPAQGAAYIFERDAGGTDFWGETKKLAAADGGTSTQFGAALAIDGDRVIIGAFLAKVGANSLQGAAYIFERGAGGANFWGEVKKLVAADGAGGDQFGVAVSISGDRAIVGAFTDQTGANSNQGSAYVFREDTGGTNNWGQVQKLTAGNGAAHDRFGFGVAVSGETALAGAFGRNVGGALGQGAAYVFAGNAGVWTEQAAISPPPPTNCGEADNYGYAVAVSGDTAVIGAPGDDVGASANQGSVYVLERNEGGANNWGLVKLLTASDGAAGDGFGISVAISGDRIIVGAFFDAAGTNTEQGAAYIFERNAGGTDNFGEVKKLAALDGTADDRLGWSVAISGGTAVVGAVKDDNFQGAAYIFERSAGGANNWGQVKKLVAAARGNLYSFGHSVSISGDSIAVGSPFDIPGSIFGQGSVSVFQRNQGGANNWGELRKITAADGGEFDQFGYSVALSGNHLVVGANVDDSGANADQGSAYIFERSAGGADNWGQIKKLAASDGGAGDDFGSSVSISGDTVIVGSPRDDINANTDQGSAYIFQQNSGGAGFWGQVKKLTANDGAANEAFGSAVAVSGDHFLVGAYLANLPFAAFTEKQTKNLLGGGSGARGAGYIFRGSAALAPTAANVGVGGRVLTADGRGISQARVTLTDARGAARSAVSNSFGYYRFTEVRAGEFYVFPVIHKGFRFAPRVLTINESLADLDFTAEN